MKTCVILPFLVIILLNKSIEHNKMCVKTFKCSIKLHHKFSSDCMLNILFTNMHINMEVFFVFVIIIIIIVIIGLQLMIRFWNRN